MIMSKETNFEASLLIPMSFLRRTPAAYLPRSSYRSCRYGKRCCFVNGSGAGLRQRLTLTALTPRTAPLVLTICFNDLSYLSRLQLRDNSVPNISASATQGREGIHGQNTIDSSTHRGSADTKTTTDIRDASLKGFGIRVYPTGHKCYFIHTQFEGKRIWKVVGDVDDMNVDKAREQARAMLVTSKGRVPIAPAEPLFEAVAAEVFRRFDRNWKLRTFAVNRGYYAEQILAWFRGQPITGISSDAIREWIGSLHATPVAADRSVPVLPVIMACAEAYGYRSEETNPCRGIRRYRRKGREWFLSEDEVRGLGTVLEQHEDNQPIHVAIVRLLLLTGCRKREIVTLRWKEYQAGHLHLEKSKTGPRMVWLSFPGRRILEEQLRTSTWVFPSSRTGKSVSASAVDFFWMRLRSEAGLQDVRLHDLRLSFASITVMTGENILTVGRLLGYNDPGTTLKYKHLANSMATEAAETLGSVLSGSSA